MRTSRTEFRVTASLMMAMLIGSWATAEVLPGYEASIHFQEQLKDFEAAPGIKVHINAPSAQTLDWSLPTRVVIYALPNGNTIPQTIGKMKREGVDWHFFIQHIGAQTRLLRSEDTKTNLVVAYVEAEGRSWPSWRRKHEDSGKHILRLISEILKDYPVDKTTFELTAHSGGGSLIFGFINACDSLPEKLNRIAFLDANYGYNHDDGHTEKLVGWLNKSDSHHLVVVAYDDRRIKIEGKLVVGPTGGTYRKTHKMVDDFGGQLTLKQESANIYNRWLGINGRLDIIVVENPEDRILHTVLVERNGFVHALTSGGRWEGRIARFYDEPAYTQWIQTD